AFIGVRCSESFDDGFAHRRPGSPGAFLADFGLIITDWFKSSDEVVLAPLEALILDLVRDRVGFRCEAFVATGNVGEHRLFAARPKQAPMRLRETRLVEDSVVSAGLERRADA